MRAENTRWMWLKIAVVAVAVAISAGCNDSGGTTSSNQVPSGTSVLTSALTIAGVPTVAVLAGNRYTFKPTAIDAERGRRVSFTIQNKPAWATFSASTGVLTGVPTSADTGEYAQIIISATDGLISAKLTPFAVTVADTASGSVTISWMPPSTNSDGSAITDLAGYAISYGQSATSLTQTVKVESVGVTNYVIDNLTPGVWYFSIRSINSNGVASASTPVVSTTIGQT